MCAKFPTVAKFGKFFLVMKEKFSHFRYIVTAAAIGSAGLAGCKEATRQAVANQPMAVRSVDCYFGKETTLIRGFEDEAAIKQAEENFQKAVEFIGGFPNPQSSSYRIIFSLGALSRKVTDPANLSIHFYQALQAFKSAEEMKNSGVPKSTIDLNEIEAKAW